MSDTTGTSSAGGPPLSQRTVGTVRRLWGLVYLRALAYLVGGVVLFANPDEGLDWLRWLVGLVILVQGILLTIEGLPSRRTPGEQGDGDEVSWRLIAGVVSIGAALVVVLWPSMSAPVMYLVVGIWACAAGVAGIIGALRGRAVRAVAWDWQFANAALWIVLGVVVLARPTGDTTTIALLLGLYLLLSGAVLLVGGLATGTRNRDARKTREAAGAPEPAARPARSRRRAAKAGSTVPGRPSPEAAGTAVPTPPPDAGPSSPPGAAPGDGGDPLRG